MNLAKDSPSKSVREICRERKSRQKEEKRQLKKLKRAVINKIVPVGLMVNRSMNTIALDMCLPDEDLEVYSQLMRFSFCSYYFSFFGFKVPARLLEAQLSSELRVIVMLRFLCFPVRLCRVVRTEQYRDDFGRRFIKYASVSPEEEYNAIEAVSEIDADMLAGQFNKALIELAETCEMKR